MELLKHWNSWLWSSIIIAGSIIAALLARFLVFAVLKRVARHHETVLGPVIRRTEKPSWWIFPLIAILIVLPGVSLPPDILTCVQHAMGLGLIAATAWLVIMISEVASDLIAARYRIDAVENLLARKVQTQLQLLHRIVVVVVIIVALAVMLMTFPTIRSIGTSLLASAGLAGLIVGMAMRPTLASLVAGIQIALTQPIRLEDSVVVEGEWGWIEEIGTTHVVVRIWDLRRLVVPLSYFIEHPFQNWTRTSAELLATVMLWVDYTTPIEELRQELRRIVQSTENWKGHVCVLQVTDASDRAIQLRALMDAPNASKAWDLRCYVREKLIQFLQQRYPDSLPRFRNDVRNLSNDRNATNEHMVHAPNISLGQSE
jgi:small-conductance mechanosensitive channel